MSVVNQNVTTATPRMLTLPEVARELRLSVRTLREPSWLVRLRAVKVGKQWLVPLGAVNEVLTGGRS